MKYLLLLLAGLAALLSDRLDKRFAQRGKLRALLLILSEGIAAVILVPVIFTLL